MLPCDSYLTQQAMVNTNAGQTTLWSVSSSVMTVFAVVVATAVYHCSSTCAFTTPLRPITTAANQIAERSGGSWGRYHGGRRPSSDDSLHSPTVIPPSALDKPIEFHEVLPSSVNVQPHLTTSFADDGNASHHHACTACTIHKDGM